MAPYCLGGKEILHPYHQCMKGLVSLTCLSTLDVFSLWDFDQFLELGWEG